MLENTVDSAVDLLRRYRQKVVVTGKWLDEDLVRAELLVDTTAQALLGLKSVEDLNKLVQGGRAELENYCPASFKMIIEPPHERLEILARIIGTDQNTGIFGRDLVGVRRSLNFTGVPVVVPLSTGVICDRMIQLSMPDKQPCGLVMAAIGPKRMDDPGKAHLAPRTSFASGDQISVNPGLDKVQIFDDNISTGRTLGAVKDALRLMNPEINIASL